MKYIFVAKKLTNLPTFGSGLFRSSLKVNFNVKEVKQGLIFLFKYTLLSLLFQNGLYLAREKFMIYISQSKII